MDWGLYLHVPFCLAKCAYCDFVSYPYAPDAAGRYLQALESEIELRCTRFVVEDTGPKTVFVGGGTPTVLPAEAVAGVIHQLAGHFPWPDGTEVSVEANPGTVDRDKLTALRAAGVNRLSIGMQAAQDHLLSTLGRLHRCGDVARAVQAARDAGFDNLNLDLIFGVPGQTVDDWRAALEAALDLKPEHIAAYSLEIPSGTRLFALLEKNLIEACPEETELEMYHFLRSTLTAQGYRQYEISNFALPGFECRHNLLYWGNENYLGLGPAAHSHFSGHRWANERSVGRYAERLEEGVLPVVEEEFLESRTQMAETMFMGLRLLRGVNLKTFRERFGTAVDEVYPAPIERLTAAGLIEFAGGYLRLTEKGLPLANIVFTEFL